MSITFIQGTGANGSTSTTLAKAYTSNLTASSYLVAFVFGGSSPTNPTATVADTHSLAWTQLNSFSFSGGGQAYLFGAPNTAGAVADTVTATFSLSADSSILGVLEYSGVFAASALDVINTNWPDTSGTSYTGAAVTTTRLNDLVLAFGYSDDAGTGTITPGGGFTVRFRGGATATCLAMDAPAATLTSYTPSLSVTGTGNETALGTIALASVAGASSGSNKRMLMGMGT
jgi:hypothetical protein